MDYYRDLSIRTLFSKQYNHILMLLFWPAFGIAFYAFEHILPLTFHPVCCSLDSVIPFCEYFIVPYYAWYVFIVVMMVYLMFKNVDQFRQYMLFIIIGYSVALVIYMIYPTSQQLRPMTFDSNNLFTKLVSGLYTVDTNTNVCPSIHVIGMMAATFAAWRADVSRPKLWKTAWAIAAVSVCLSTVFLKQHSAVDVVCGMIVSVGVYLLVYKVLPSKQ